MQRILGKRVFRDLKSNFFRYFALFLLIVLGMYLVIAVIGSGEAIMQSVETAYAQNKGEDGQFGTFVPLSDAEKQQIEEKGVTLEEAFYLDYKAEESTLRVMQERQQIDLFVPTEGRTLENPGEVLLEQHYAQQHGYTLGSSIQIGSTAFTVVGLGSTPDYDGMYEKTTDSSIDSEKFGTAFVTAEDYERLKEKKESFKTEEYVYAFLLNGKMTGEELQELIQSFTLDRDKVTDVYFLEMLDEIEESKKEIQDGIEELLDGSRELSDGLQEIADHNEELQDAADSLFEAMLEQANDSFAENEIPVTLQADSFESQLDNMIASVGKYSTATKDSLRDLKETLQGLQEFREGVAEYTDGVHSVKDGTGILRDGLNELTGYNETLQQGAQLLFQTMLQQTQAQLTEALAGTGVTLPEELTEDNFTEIIDTLIQNYGAFFPQLAEQLTSVKEQLLTLKSFRDGIVTYTQGAAAARDGSQTLFDGTAVLDGSSSVLQEAADTILDSMIEMVQEQLAEGDITVSLTRENFEQELDALIGTDSQIDTELKNTLKDTKETFLELQDFKEGIKEYTDAVQEAADGSRELTDGVEELRDAANDMIDEFMTFDIDNLTSFLNKKDNPRIYASYNDVIINKYAGIAAGIIIMALFTYVISVFVIHNIEQESTIIGALYALGVKRQQLVLHYLLLPVVVTLLGGIAGSIVGFSPIGVAWQMQDSIAYFSLPPVHVVYPPYLLVYSLVMPPVTAVIVNYLCINKKLKCTALSLMRGEQKVSRIREVNLGRRMGFVRRFQIRQMLRELRSAAAVMIGMYVCLLIAMLCLDCYVMCENYRKAAINETKFEYMYTYKYPTKEVPEGGTPAYVEGLYREAYGYNLEVTLFGLTKDNPYYDIEVSDRKNEIVISSAVAEKFRLSTGDKMILSDEVNHQDYAFTVKDVVYMESAFYTFMDIDAMRELFGQEEDYYNVVLADRPLSIDAGRLYSTTSKEDIMAACSVFTNMMMPMIILLSAVAALIFIVVMYLMIKVMIDRSSFSIALVKIFGFRKREIKKLYLNGNFILVALGALVSIPLSKWSMDAIYPYCISNVAIGMDLRFDRAMYLGLYVAILLCYLLINPLLMRRINKMLPAEVLKNRE